LKSPDASPGGTVIRPLTCSLLDAPHSVPPELPFGWHHVMGSTFRWATGSTVGNLPQSSPAMTSSAAVTKKSTEDSIVSRRPRVSGYPCDGKCRKTVRHRRRPNAFPVALALPADPDRSPYCSVSPGPAPPGRRSMLFFQQPSALILRAAGASRLWQ